MASEALISKTPREQAGSQSFRSFDFQVHASMARILEAYQNGEGFVAYFDLFDDLIFLSEDDGKRHAAEVQKATDAAVAEVDTVTAAKEKEIMHV